MKKQQSRQRKKRKCEQGIKTKSHNKGCRYVLTASGMRPLPNYLRVN